MSKRQGSIARRVLVVVAAVTIVQALAIEALAAQPAKPAVAPGTVVGETFDPMLLPSGQALSARARANLRHMEQARRQERTRPGAAATGAAAVVAKAERVGSDAAASTAEAAVASVAGGISLLHTTPAFVGSDTTAGIVGGKVVYGGSTHIVADPHLPTGSGIKAWDVADFFALPNADWYWGATVSASIFQGRYVAALPSYTGPGGGCTTGYMNVAVSTSTDPTKPWKRYRLSIGDAWTDAIQIGVSDDKVVLSTNRWDLSAAQSDCLGAPYEGARLRVMDWADLLDGGTLTTKDVSPTSYTSYYSWVAATNVAGTASTSAAKTLYLAGDKLSGTWGNFVFATITGSVKGGTAKLARNENLTSSGVISLLTPPPDTIAAFNNGNGFQDERIVSVSYRSSRFWAAATVSCRVTAEAPARACARYIQLNTSTTPATKVESAFVTDVDRDTFVPLVGFSRDGGSNFTMASATAVAHEEIVQLAMYRASGATLVGGDDEIGIWFGEQASDEDYWGTTGTVMAVPNDSRAVLAFYPAAANGQAARTWATQLRGGQSASPGGSIDKLGNGSGWNTSPDISPVVLRPLASSPINRMRYSASPDVESTAGGPLLVNGVELPPFATIGSIDMANASIGGNTDDGNHTLYVQWQTWDGTWSAPVSKSFQIDTTAPTIGAPNLAFTTGTIGSSAPVKYTWLGADAQSGVGSYIIHDDRQEPTPLDATSTVPPTTTTLVVSRRLDASYQYRVGVDVIDRAGNFGQGGGVTAQFGSVQSSANMSFVKTWSTGTSSNYLGGTTRYATAAGATVTYTCTCRAIGWVTTKASNRGKAEIWVDGVLKTTVDTYSSTTKYRQLGYQVWWTANGSHTIKIKVLGTSGRARVDFDSFLKAY